MTKTTQRILFLSNMTNYSGGEIVLERLIQHLDPDKFECTVCLPEGPFADRCRRNNIPVVINNRIVKLSRSTGGVNYLAYFKAMISGLAETRNFIKKQGIDLVVANSFGVFVWGFLLSFLISKKIIWIHHHPILDGKKIDSKLARIFAGRVPAIVCVSQAIKNSLVKAGVREQKCQVIYNGLDLEKFRPAAIEPFTTTVKIALVGAIVSWKGQDFLIEAIHLLRPEIKAQVEVDIVGSFLTDTEENRAYKNKIEQDIKRYDLESKVTLVGHVEDMPSYYRDRLDILVNASQQPEPLGTTIYEAMAFSKVSIATRVGGSPEIIADRIDGYLVSEKDPSDLAKVIERIIVDEDHLVENIRVEARKTVERKFNIQTTAGQYETLFQSLI